MATAFDKPLLDKLSKTKTNLVGRGLRELFAQLLKGRFRAGRDRGKD
jgi:hypothetical protein